MAQSARIYVAGHRGLAGAALLRCLRKLGYDDLITRSHAELDLTDQTAVRSFFEQERPEYVFLAAAKVGGILANQTRPAEFVSDNLAIQNNVLHEAWRTGVRRLLFLGSSCVYPRDCPQPIAESYLLSGPLETTNQAYAIAKIAGIETCRSFNQQYGARYLAAMPSNLYGPGDNYDPQSAHVLPALIRKLHEAKVRGDTQVTAWGTGAPRREWLYSEDLAAACVRLMTLADNAFDAIARPACEDGTLAAPLINIGPGVDLTIRELTELVKSIVEYRGAIAWDTTKPDGTPRKLLDVSRIQALGWRPAHSLADGIRLCYRDFLSRGI